MQQNMEQKPHPDWSRELWMAIRKQLRDDELWTPLLDECHGKDRTRSIHLGVFVEPFLTYILQKRKTVESRFSVNRIAPYGTVCNGDLLVLKEVSGPVCGICTVHRVWHYQLTGNSIDDIRRTFAKRICADDPEFWESKSRANYVTLMMISTVRELRPIRIAKKDRRGWVNLFTDNSGSHADE
jgi:hypothetical protein